MIRCGGWRGTRRAHRTTGRNVDPEFDELKREFLAEADEKVREIQAKLDGDRGPQSLERLVYLAHQLKGSGGSYGYEKISSDAAEIEKALERMAGGDRAGVEAQIQQHAVDLRTEIDKAARELTAATA